MSGYIVYRYTQNLLTGANDTWSYGTIVLMVPIRPVTSIPSVSMLANSQLYNLGFVSDCNNRQVKEWMVNFLLFTFNIDLVYVHSKTYIIYTSVCTFVKHNMW